MLDVNRISVLAILIVGGLQGPHTAQKAAGPIDVKLMLGQPVQSGPVTIVPIESAVPIAREKYLTFAEASKMGLVEIVEMPGQEEVNSLEVRNKSKLPILLFAGELLLGGKQDRIVAKDSIVPALERRDVPVFCVEHGRWEGKPVFQSGDTFVPDTVRSTALRSSDQVQVWAQVAQSNKAVMAAPATGTIRGTLNDTKTKAASDRLLVGINARFTPTSRTVGVICCINGKIESADIFANPNLFAQSKSKLFHSYALDAALSSSARSTLVDLKACNAFLKQIVSARRQSAGESRDGRAYLVNSNGVEGYEYGNGRFNGGLSLSPKAVTGGSAASGTITLSSGAGGAGGFGHGTYKPAPGKSGG